MSKQEPTSRRTDRAEAGDLTHELRPRKPLAGESSLTDALNEMVAEGTLYEKLPDHRVHCFACGHHCKISDGGRGVCQVRYNIGGQLYVPRGYVVALNSDPIEKKPFYHVYPGSDALTFGMLGCDLHCLYCQNWDISQALRDANAGRPPTLVTADQVAQAGKRHGARVVASSYNEPLITSEWAVEIMKQANALGLLGAYVSNGNATREVLEYIRPYVSAYKIDLKSMRDKSYRALGVPMQNVLDGIRMTHAMGFWLEIVTLTVPGFNDSKEELRDAAEFIASVSRDIPWHVTAFHSDYKMQDYGNTPAHTLLRACEIGRAAGLNYVYAGNIPGGAGSWENTYCPQCHTPLIERMGFAVLDYHLTAEGKCSQCGTAIPGIWPERPDEVQRAPAHLWYRRRPRGI
ncbi:MAG: AmmeMemoRadiSam system radical SAM enzyme [Anaerolineae bacterium]